MTNELKLSVLIPVYNRPDRLDLALQCYLVNKRTDIEFVIIDNNSEKDIKAIIDKYSKEDNRIRFIKNFKNVGAARSVFRCLLEARAPYITFMCDDDYCTEGFFDLVIDAFDKHPSVGVVHSYEMLEEFKNEIAKHGEAGKHFSNQRDSFIHGFLMSGALPGLSFRKNTINLEQLKLDNSIYPQVRIASFITLKHCFFLISSLKEYKISNKFQLKTSIQEVISYQNRPADFGIGERLDTLMDAYHYDTNNVINASTICYLKAKKVLWGFKLIKKIKVDNPNSPVIGRMLGALSKNTYTKNSPIFIGFLFRDGYYMKGIVQFIRSIFSISFYAEILPLFKAYKDWKLTTSK